MDSLSIDDMQGVLEDIRKLFTRVHQLEMRQVAGKRDVEMQLREVERRQDGELTSLRASTSALERKDSVQDALLEGLSKDTLERNVEQLALQSQELGKTCEENSQLLSTLKAWLESLELAKTETNQFKQGINQRLDEMTGSLARKDMMEGQAILIKGCEKKLTVHTDRLKHISQALEDQGKVMEKHGISSNTDSLSSRLVKAEEACNRAKQSVTEAREEVEGLASRAEEGLIRFEHEISETREEMSSEFTDLHKRLIIVEEGTANLTELLQRAHLFDPDVSTANEGASPSGLDRINTGNTSKAGVSGAELVQCLDDTQDLLRWRTKVKDEMDRLHRLGRIMEDRLEAFDVLERRTEDLAQHLEGKPRDPSPPRGARSRSSSPGWRAVRQEPPDLTLTGKGSPKEEAPGHISAPSFAGTGFAKAPPRRPYSAGAVRGEGTISQLQQLREKILQAVPALPPELQKQLEAANSAAGAKGVFPRPPAAGAAFAVCRPGSRPGSALKRRPVSAR